MRLHIFCFPIYFSFSRSAHQRSRWIECVRFLFLSLSFFIIIMFYATVSTFELFIRDERLLEHYNLHTHTNSHAQAHTNTHFIWGLLRLEIKLNI